LKNGLICYIIYLLYREVKIYALKKRSRQAYFTERKSLVEDF